VQPLGIFRIKILEPKKKILTFVDMGVYSPVVVIIQEMRFAQETHKRKDTTLMKKLVTLALCLSLALAFGCKKKEEAPAPAPAPAPAAEAQKPMSSAKQAPAAPAAPAAPEKKH
jgi:hypothetical protein